ncbi:putative ARS binding protein 1 [Phytophthora cinnamomi]|uniref:putative ARS binding protein 1 n=1 Tax=Phytophthora cinnamomi TaxID=4785 RepID=UPI003559E709|nr:putative ARS binding protein 1 [Phytophthora cinnamomi]
MTTPRLAGDARRPRRNLTYREKLAIVQKKEEEPAWTQRSLALWAKEQFRLESRPTQATISNLLRGKHKLLAAAVPPDFRSARRVRHPELDRLVLRWVQEQQQQQLRPVTRLAIQHKALELARELQLPADLSFSKGWVSSFMNRHQLSIGRREDAPPAQPQQQQVLQTTRQEPVVVVAETPTVVLVEQETQEEEEEEEVVDQSLEVEQEVEREEGSSTVRQSVEEENAGDWSSSGREEGRATTELLLDWVAVPGSYSRWWLLKSDEEKEPLCGEINLFLRSHGLRNMSSADIRQQLSTFVMTFQAAHTWLTQTRVEYPLDVRDMTLEQEGIKSHVRQMCPHYERLTPVLAAYIKYDDSAADAMQGSEVLLAPATIETAAQVSSEAALSAASDDTSVADGTPPRPAKKPRRQSTESTADDDSEDETKAQKRRLFELECARLQSEIETRNIQLVLEKTLARKKLLDAGISAAEVDRIFPL